MEIYGDIAPLKSVQLTERGETPVCYGWWGVQNPHQHHQHLHRESTRLLDYFADIGYAGVFIFCSAECCLVSISIVLHFPCFVMYVFADNSC